MLLFCLILKGKMLNNNMIFCWVKLFDDMHKKRQINRNDLPQKNFAEVIYKSMVSPIFTKISSLPALLNASLAALWSILI